MKNKAHIIKLTDIEHIIKEDFDVPVEKVVASTLDKEILDKDILNGSLDGTREVPSDRKSGEEPQEQNV